MEKLRNHLEAGLTIEQTRNLLGLRVHKIREHDLMALALDNASKNKGGVITYANAFTLWLAQRQPEFAATLNCCDLCYPDGVGVALTSLLLGHGNMPKTTANRFFLELCHRAAQLRLSLALLGGKPGVATQVAATIRDRILCPVSLAAADGYQTSTEFCKTIEYFRQFAPKLIFLGMGQPRQEETALRLHVALPGSTILCVGGLFDVIAGVLPNCPAVLREAGLEWFFRLITRPQRVWRRYLLGIPGLAISIAGERYKTSRLNQWLQNQPPRTPSTENEKGG
ncbi:MAG: WecB/TagA/CpsF family glycosyltransferase [Verrucomicrobiota bacterium]|nr:WecB/TagA/CpsF family glycosyltransferase [Verrucomicrobiota bacterium]